MRQRHSQDDTQTCRRVVSLFENVTFSHLLRLRKSRGAREEANPSHHLHRLPPLFCCCITSPARERPDWTRGRFTNKQTGADGPSLVSWDGSHQTSPPGAAGEMGRWGEGRRRKTESLMPVLPEKKHVGCTLIDRGMTWSYQCLCQVFLI